MGIQDRRESQSPRIQDPVSTMQKTGLTNFSSFLDWYDVEKGITYGCDHFIWGSQQPFSCVFGHFRHGGDKQSTKQPGDPSASLLLTSEKAVFCNVWKFCGIF